MIGAGLLLPYGLQILMVFVLAFVGFRTGIFGGADGKALLLISLTYPWIILDLVWLILAPLFILLGSFLLLGIHSVMVLLMNLITWKQSVSNRDEKCPPKKRVFWVTRRLKGKTDASGGMDWEPIIVPLISYFLVSYLVLLLLSTGLILVSG
jgi:hypothetical protein